jgi:hypothetical protein
LSQINEDGKKEGSSWLYPFDNSLELLILDPVGKCKGEEEERIER